MTTTPIDLSQIEARAKAAIASGREYFHDLKVLDVEEIDDFAIEASPESIQTLARAYRRLREALLPYLCKHCQPRKRTTAFNGEQCNHACAALAEADKDVNCG